MVEELDSESGKSHALREIVAKYGRIHPPRPYRTEQTPVADATSRLNVVLTHTPPPVMLVDCDEHKDTNTSDSGSNQPTNASGSNQPTSASGSYQPASASSSNRPASAKSSSSGVPGKNNCSQCWQVVWCQERCFRDHMSRWRNNLKMIANTLGGDLACVKRPGKLAQHFETLKNERPRAHLMYWVVVTTWREAKPIVELCEQGTILMPRFMVVVCEAGSQYRKASQWAESQNQPFPIYCVRAGIDSIAEGPLSADKELREIFDLLSVPSDELPLPSVFHLCRACTKSAIDLNAVTAEQLPNLLKHPVRLSL
eukprot:TRINITY_DN62476_c0_g1_i1.p1 TRINITY_DN62476_c0_g1~~TRINITY_DN62476_c0_g1_i1.p1  ORF type:complete len:312 (+),score=55.80 TRINITY_DN62476_c0_g1_i1:169-1104(+)